MSVAEYDPKNMIFRRLGNSGLRVSLFSLGGWLTYGGSVDEAKTKEIMDVAYKAGISTFDTAEVYSSGKCEVAMGKAIKELGWRRSDVVLITKIFFGSGQSKDPNARGLSRKHIIEGTEQSLERAGLRYWDVVMAHRYDATIPMEEIVRAFNAIIDKGYAFYWGTSEWSASQISEACQVAARLNLIPPVADQAQYSLLHRNKLEGEYLDIFREHGYGTTIWSPLASGLLTGKYANGIPAGSRFDTNSAFFKDTVASLQTPEGKEKLDKVHKLSQLAESKLGCSMATLAIAWCAKNENVSTVILGASKPEQVLENLKALDVLDKLTPEIMAEIDDIVKNKPAAIPTYGR